MYNGIIYINIHKYILFTMTNNNSEKQRGPGNDGCRSVVVSLHFNLWYIIIAHVIYVWSLEVTHVSIIRCGCSVVAI